MPRIVITRGRGSVDIGERLVVGRAEGGPFDDPEISRRHAMLSTAADGTLTIEDLGSRNGTWVNGERLAEARALVAGDQVRMGHSTFELEGVAPATAPRPPLAAAPAFAPPPVPGRGTGRRRRGSHLPVVLLALFACIALIAMLVVAVTNGNGAGFSCQNHADPSEPVAMTAYVESNIAAPDDNAVMVLRYAQGDLRPLPIDCFRTGGSGSHDLSDTGVLDSDQQVVLDPVNHRLYAINQGSDSFGAVEGDPARRRPAAGDRGAERLDCIVISFMMKEKETCYMPCLSRR
jgi:hypothetical protein